mgnify:CR=1 FL=1
MIENLTKAGAFDQFGYHRAQIMMGYQKFLDRALEFQKDRELGQVSLFDLSSQEETAVILPEVKVWSRVQSLSFEKEVLGFYLSDHPLRGFENFSKVWSSSSVLDLPKYFLEKSNLMQSQMKPEERSAKPKWGDQKIGRAHV